MLLHDSNDLLLFIYFIMMPSVAHHLLLMLRLTVMIGMPHLEAPGRHASYHAAHISNASSI